MSRTVPLIAGLLGFVFLALAAVYWLTPADGLPSFLPGFQAGSDHVHVTHALASLIVGLGLFVIAILWFQLTSEDY
jgi:hypothetical protein